MVKQNYEKGLKFFVWQEML